MTFDEIRSEIRSIGKEDGNTPAQERILDVLDELTIATQSIHARIQELTLYQNQGGRPPGIETK